MLEGFVLYLCVCVFHYNCQPAVPSFSMCACRLVCTVSVFYSNIFVHYCLYAFLPLRCVFVCVSICSA